MEFKLNNRSASVLIEILISLCILLFVYAAVSKLLDYTSFKIQIGQSPVLSAYAGWLAWVVPAFELIIAIFLVVPKLRFIGLLGFYIIMVSFTTYILIILNYSDFIPCSCGGILENLSWTQHLVLNGLFCLTALYILQVLNKRGLKETK